jgi:hypothetical protein
MSPGRFTALLVAALAVISFAFWLSTQRYLPRDDAFGARVFPGLDGRLDDVKGLRIVGPGGVALVTLDRPDGRWEVAERGYPADGRRARALLQSLAALQVVEPKTRDPDGYSRLGVEDVGRAGASGVRIDVRGLDAPLSLIVGRDADAGTAYVRVPDAAEALLVQPALDLPRDPREWLARRVVDVTPARIQSFEIERDGERAWRGEKSARADAHFTLGGLPAGREPYAADAADTVANALAGFEIEDVERASAVPPTATPTARAVFRTFDGLVVTLYGRADDRGYWVRLEAAHDAGLAARFPAGAGDDAPGVEQVRAAADRLSTTAEGWWYRISPDRYDCAFRPLEGLLAPRGLH